MNNDYVIINNEIKNTYIEVLKYSKNIYLNLSKTNNIYIIDNYNSYFNDIIYYFNNNKDDIIKQFIIDCKRSIFIYNDKKVNNLNLFINNFKNKYKNYNDILLLCNQSIFSKIFKSLGNNLLKKKLYLSEIKNKVNKMIIKINDNENNNKSDKVKVTCIKNLRIFYLDSNSDDITTHLIKINMNIYFNSYVYININIIKIK